MTTPETLKPLVDRIVSNPLQFKAASKVSGQKEEDKSLYIIIGSPNQVLVTKAKEEGLEMAVSRKSHVKKAKLLPKSMAEAIAMYTKGNAVEQSKEQDLSDIDYQEAASSGASSSSGGEDVFHETKEYVADSDDSNKIKEDLGGIIDEELGDIVDEDFGLPLDEGFKNTEKIDGSTAEAKLESTEKEDEDEDEDDEDDANFEMNKDESESEDKSESESGNEKEDESVSDNERVQLQKEAQEYNKGSIDDDDEMEEDEEEQEEAEEELKHKESSSKSQSPKLAAAVTREELEHPKDSDSSVSELSKFYQYNENINDAGSIKGSHIVKNWGSVLTNLKPCGLLNHGVTCYTNAAVQAMLHIPAMQHYLFDILRGKYSSTVKHDSVSYILAETSKKMWWKEKKSNNSTFINPKKLISKLDDINCMMSEWQQEDSHEYFMSLMSRLQEDSVPRGHKMTESIIYDIFGGLLKQNVTCKSCGGVSMTEQPFYDLSLHLKGKKKQVLANDDSAPPSPQSPSSASYDTKQLQTDPHSNSSNEDSSSTNRFTIEKSIRDFFNPELIKINKEREGYLCERCNKTTNAIKRNTIIRPPETLLVHLKKFRFNGQSSSKMKQAVSYPMFLDLTEYCETPRGAKKKVPVKYQLMSVVVHEGRSLSSGHYIAHCRQPDGSFAIYDDEYINKITEGNVLREPNAYYMVYTRLTPKEIPLRDPPLKNKDVSIPMQTSSPSSSNSSPQVNKNVNRKKSNKNKKRRFNKY